MENDFKHIILTRFNFGLYSPEKYWNYYKNSDPESWMEKRLDLFETYCIPSIKNQNNKNFDWIVLFDIKTPEKYKERIRNYHEVCEPIFSDMEGLAVKAKDKAKSVEMIITTRVDNDDEILPDFIKIIQENRNQCSEFPFFINLDNGFLKNVKTNKIGEFNGKSNMFVSVIEKTINSKTIYEYGNHTQLKKFGKIISIKNERLWIWNIHGSNKSYLPLNKKV